MKPVEEYTYAGTSNQISPMIIKKSASVILPRGIDVHSQASIELRDSYSQTDENIYLHDSVSDNNSLGGSDDDFDDDAKTVKHKSMCSAARSEYTDDMYKSLNSLMLEQTKLQREQL